MADDTNYDENDNVGGTSSNGIGNFDLGSLGNIASLLNNIDLSQLGALFGSFNSGGGERKAHRSGDRGIELLNALKPMVSAERADIIDMIIQVYLIKRILKG